MYRILLFVVCVFLVGCKEADKKHVETIRRDIVGIKVPDGAIYKGWTFSSAVKVKVVDYNGLSGNCLCEMIDSNEKSESMKGFFRVELKRIIDGECYINGVELIKTNIEVAKK